MKKKILFIINPVAGMRRKDKIPRHINKYLDHERFDYDVIYTESRGHATEIASKAVLDKIDIVAVAGGDGSVNEVATGLLNSETALAIIPSGSGNGLARHLGYSINIRSTLEIINNYKVEKIDVCKINNDYFFSLIGIGFDAFVAKVFSREETRGFFTYLWSAIKSVSSFDSFEYSFQSKEKKFSGRAFMINVCNSNQYGYNVKVAPNASLKDGMMDVVIVDNIPKWKIPLAVIRVFTQTHLSSKHFRTFQTSELLIESPNYSYLQIDGETVHKDKEFRVTIIPQALNVLVNNKTN
ncbi:MAG: diacylglycerol/lipid kinase family protein [Chitinophagales bacterium]